MVGGYQLLLKIAHKHFITLHTFLHGILYAYTKFMRMCAKMCYIFDYVTLNGHYRGHYVSNASVVPKNVGSIASNVQVLFAIV